MDVVRCRRNAPAADGVEPVDGVLPDLSFVEAVDARQSYLNLLPYVGPRTMRTVE